MGYKVLHVPYFEWRQLRSAKDREDYMRTKLKEEPSEWLDPEDEKYYNQGAEGEGEDFGEEFSVKPETVETVAWPSTPPPPKTQATAATAATAATPETPPGPPGAPQAPRTPKPPPPGTPPPFPAFPPPPDK